MEWHITDIQPSSYEEGRFDAYFNPGWLATFTIIDEGVEVEEIHDHGERTYMDYSLADIDGLEAAIEKFLERQP